MPTSDLKIYKEIESMWYRSIDQAFGYCHTFDMNLNPKYKFFSLQEDLSTALIFTNREKKRNQFFRVLVHDHLDMPDTRVFYYMHGPLISKSK